MQNSLIVKDKELKVTLSIGISMLTGENETFEQLINKADQAMYAAKDNGRNRIEISGNKSKPS